MTAGQIIEVLRRVPADTLVLLAADGIAHPVTEVTREQLLADGPPNPLGGPTKIGTGVWQVTIR